MKNVWTVICKKSVIDQDSNNLNLFEVIEEINVPADIRKFLKDGVKIAPVEFEVINLWVINKGEKGKNQEIRIELYDPSNKKLKDYIHSFSIAQHFKKRIRTRMKIFGFPLSKEGEYKFRIKIKEGAKKEFITVSEVPIDIVFNKNIKIKEENKSISN
ncbi:hypothetical protein HQ544_04960 [Candidatus Falkowbacteria bacterium]|nr:hypothetical protein [Candidatus Falkowbacteria bacterium]